MAEYLMSSGHRFFCLIVRKLRHILIRKYPDKIIWLF